MSKKFRERERENGGVRRLKNGTEVDAFKP